MSVTWDYDSRWPLDIFVTNFMDQGRPALYHNLGATGFDDCQLEKQAWLRPAYPS